MSRDPFVRLADIIEACDAVANYIDGYDFTRFSDDAKTRDAVIRQCEIIGEAVKHVPERMRAAQPSIPWRAIAGFRDVLAHTYFAVENSIVWQVASDRLPELRAACVRLASSN